MIEKIKSNKEFFLFGALILLVYFILLLALNSLNTTPGSASASWYDTNWQYRKLITIDNTQVEGTNDFTDFPLMIDTTDTDLQSNAQSSGNDILFTLSDGTTKISHDIETFNAGTGQLVAWIELPTLSTSTDTEIYMYYGNGAATNQEDEAGTWSQYYSVWNFGEGTGSTIGDSTSSGLDATIQNNSGSWAAGITGDSYDFSDTDYAVTASNFTFPTNAGSVSFWINFSSNPGALSFHNILGSADLFEARMGNLNSKIKMEFQEFDGTGDAETVRSSWSQGTWYYVTAAFTEDGRSVVEVHNDNSKVDVLGDQGILGAPPAAPMYLGDSRNLGSYLPARLDNVRFASHSYGLNIGSTDWFSTEYNNLTSPNIFYTIGAQEVPSANLIIDTFGSPISNLSVGGGAENIYVGAGFSIRTDGASATVDRVDIREYSTLDGINDVDHIKFYYDYDTTAPYTCDDQPFTGTEFRKYGLTVQDFTLSEGGEAIFEGSANISGTQALCLYPVVDFTSAVSSDRQFEFSIFDPSVDVVATGASTSSTTPIGLGTAGVDGDNPYRQSWYNPDWLNRKRVNIDHTHVEAWGGTGPDEEWIYTMPLVINLTDGHLSPRALANGNDILFTNTYGVKLDHELEFYESSTGEVMAWVEIPHIYFSKDTPIYMYYRNGSATNQENPTGVWNTGNFRAVYHMSEDPGAGNILDSTSNGYHLTPHTSMNASDSVTGKIGSAISFDGVDDRLYRDIPDINSGATVVMWGKTANTSQSEYTGLFSSADNALNSSFQIDFGGPGEGFSGSYRLLRSNSSGLSEALDMGSIATSTWQHLGYYHLNNGFIFNTLQNGLIIDSGSDSIPPLIDKIKVGANRGTNRFFAGEIDELWILERAAPQDWIQTVYNNQNLLSAFVNPDPAEARVEVSSFGSANTNLPKDRNQYLGGGFSFSSPAPTTITGITITENGTLDGSVHVDNVKLYYEFDTSNPYDCASESFNGTERKFGLTATGGFNAGEGGIATFTSSSGINISGNSTACVYPVVDFENFTDTRDFNISINNPYLDVTAINRTVAPEASQSPGTGSVDGTAALNRSWYDLDWPYRKEVSIDNTQVANASTPNDEDDLYDFPVLLRITDTDLSNHAQTNGDDIFFTNTYGTKIPHEIESYDSATGELVAWVKVPHVYYNADTPYVMYYGNSGAANQEDAAEVWSSNYKIVQHFEETTAGNTDFLDSTVNGNDSTFVELSDPTPADVGGNIGSGVRLAGIEDRIEVPFPAATSTLTISSWVNLDDLSTNRTLWGTFDTFSGYNAVVNTDGSVNLNFSGSASTGTNTITTGNWYYVSIKFGGTPIIYVNGVDVTTSSSSGSITTGTANAIGADGSDSVSGNNACNSFYCPWDGLYDEFRFYDATLSADWILTEYNNQRPGASFETIGPEELGEVAPQLNEVDLNNNSDINLTEATTTPIQVTASVSDENGTGDIVSANVKVYRSGVGANCSVNDNNCYASSCTIGTCSLGTCPVSCTVNIQYFAEPTDTGTYSAESWLARVEAIDTTSRSGFGTGTAVVEMNSLLALSLNNNINFGTLFAGDNSGSTNSTVQVENTGNVSIDVEVSGTDMCSDYPTCSGGVIPVNNLEYSNSAFTYGAGVDLNTTPTLLTLNLLKPTSTTPVTADIFWGIALPSPLVPGDYTGVVQVGAVNN